MLHGVWSILLPVGAAATSAAVLIALAGLIVVAG
jgi:hypothetical protein